MTKKLSEYPTSFRQKHSAMDDLPTDVYDQIVDALTNKTHSIPAVVWWLHEEFGDDYAHISASLVRQWWSRRKPRGFA